MSSRISDTRLYIPEDSVHIPSMNGSQSRHAFLHCGADWESRMSSPSQFSQSDTSEPIHELKEERVSTPEDDQPISPRTDTPTCRSSDVTSSAQRNKSIYLASTSQKKRFEDIQEPAIELPERESDQNKIELEHKSHLSWSSSMSAREVRKAVQWRSMKDSQTRYDTNRSCSESKVRCTVKHMNDTVRVPQRP